MTLFRRVAASARPPGRRLGRGGRAGGHPGAGADRFLARFTATDAMVLRDLAGQLAELVGGSAAPADPGGTAQPGPGGAPQPGPGGQGPGERDDAATADDLAEMLGLTEDAVPPDDPALARLLPDAYPDDPRASGEFRRYTERDLRAGKVAAARTLLATLPPSGGRVSLSGDEAEAWLRALNDIRLALGVRLGITQEGDAEIGRRDSHDPRFAALALYDWLSAMQESLVRALW